MKLLNDIVKSLTRRVDLIFQVIMDSVQFYSPPPRVGYPRIIKRLEPTKEEIEKRLKEEEEKRLLEMKLKEEQDLLELDAKIIAKENKVNELFQENITTKILIPKNKTIPLSKKQLKAQKNMQNRKEKANLLFTDGNNAANPSNTVDPSIDINNFNNTNNKNNELFNNLNQTNDLFHRSGKNISSSNDNHETKRSQRLPVAQVVNVSWNQPSSTSSSSSKFRPALLNNNTTLPPISTWKVPKTSLRLFFSIYLIILFLFFKIDHFVQFELLHHQRKKIFGHHFYLIQIIMIQVIIFYQKVMLI